MFLENIFHRNKRSMIRDDKGQNVIVMDAAAYFVDFAPFLFVINFSPVGVVVV